MVHIFSGTTDQGSAETTVSKPEAQSVRVHAKIALGHLKSTNAVELVAGAIIDTARTIVRASQQLSLGQFSRFQSGVTTCRSRKDCPLMSPVTLQAGPVAEEHFVIARRRSSNTKYGRRPTIGTEHPVSWSQIAVARPTIGSINKRGIEHLFACISGDAIAIHPTVDELQQVLHLPGEEINRPDLADERIQGRLRPLHGSILT